MFSLPKGTFRPKSRIEFSDWSSLRTRKTVVRRPHLRNETTKPVPFTHRETVLGMGPGGGSELNEGTGKVVNVITRDRLTI